MKELIYAVFNYAGSVTKSSILQYINLLKYEERQFGKDHCVAIEKLEDLREKATE